MAHNHVIPKDTALAAKRGFVRTAAQSLAGTIPTAAITGAALSGTDVATVGWAVCAAALSSLLAGLASALHIVAGGIPEEYQAATTGKTGPDAT